MEKVIKKISSRALSVLLALLMVAAPFVSVVGELGIFAGAAGDDSNGSSQTNTAYSNTDFSVVTSIAVVGSGVGSKGDVISQALANTLRSVSGDKLPVTYYASLDAAKASDASLIIYACGTQEAVNFEYTSPAEYGENLTTEVESIKALGKDVLLVTPGPVVAYGEGMIYGPNSAFNPEQVTTGTNVYNAVSRYVDAIESVASSCNVGVLSILGKASLYGIDKYMEGTEAGIYPATIDNYVAWIAEYVSENYVLATENSYIGTSSFVSAKNEMVVDFADFGIADGVVSDFDAVVITVPAGSEIPENITVQTAKKESDKWFEPIAKIKQTPDETGVFTCALVFDASVARYVRVATDGSFPQNTTISFYKTRISNPVITNPVNGQALSTKQAFNVEWSAVANADRYIVRIMNGSTVVKEITTSNNSQAFPAGILEDGVSYTVTVESLGSGYFTVDYTHGGVSTAVEFEASVTAPLIDSSESIEEDVSAGKLITLGSVTDLSLVPNKNGTQKTFSLTTSGNNVSMTSGALNYLTDGVLGDFGNATNTFVAFTDGVAPATPSNGWVELTLDLEESYQLSTISFDTAFLVSNQTANGAPVRVQFQYSNDNATWSAPADFYTASSARTINIGEAKFPMTKYLRTTDVNARYVRVRIELSQASTYRNLLIDEIEINGYAKETGVVVRDGSYYFNTQLVGASRYDGTYTNKYWEKGTGFVAVAPKKATEGTNAPVELVIDLNTDYDNNEIASGDHLVTSLNIGFATDATAIRPSSITVSVQKTSEAADDKWTVVGSKVYTDATEVGYTDEHIALTSADASDIYAAKVKVSLYTNETTTDIPASYDASGFWGKWFAISYVKLVGGQYIGSIEADGATAAYHANYLQNTKLSEGENFGDVNNNDIWNSIAWKSAGYKVANSGYSEADGNITAGKIYWASEKPNASASTPATTETQTPSAVNPNASLNQTAKATNIAQGKKYTVNATPHGNYSDDTTTPIVTDGHIPEHRPGYTNGVKRWLGFCISGGDTPPNNKLEVIVDLQSAYNITSVDVYLDWLTAPAPPKSVIVQYSSDGTSFKSDADITAASSATDVTNAASGQVAANEKCQKHTANKTVTNVRYIKVSITADASATNHRIYLGEIQAFGAAYTGGDLNVVPATGEIGNVAPAGTYSYNGLLPGDGIGYAEGTQGVVMAEDYEKPDYKNAGYSSTTYAQGGTGHRNTKGTFAVGKLNDGVEAKYSAGYAPYHWVGWHQKNGTTAMEIVFDLKLSYHITEIYFKNSGRQNTNQADAYKAYTVTYYYSNDNKNWTSGKNGTWPTKYDSTLPKNETNNTPQYMYTNRVTGDTSNPYRYVKIKVNNTNASLTNIHFYLDEVIIKAYLGENVGPSTTPKNWALKANGGTYKGANGTTNPDSNNADTGTWGAYHSGKLNDGTISTDRAGASGASLVGMQPGSAGTDDIAFKLSSLVDVTSVVVYLTPRYLAGATGVGGLPDNYVLPDSIEVLVSNEDDPSKATRFGGATSFTSYSGNPSTGAGNGGAFVYTINGALTGKYVYINIAHAGYYVYASEIQINGIKSTQLEAPVITSHKDDDEIGVETTLDWTDIPVEDGVIVYYDVTVTDSKGTTTTALTNLPTSQGILTDSAYTLGEGYYLITVIAKASGWTSSQTSINVYYSPKYIITFHAADGALLKSAGQTANVITLGVYLGSEWSDAEVSSSIASVIGLPYKGADGQLYYFSHWVDINGFVGIPSVGEVTGNVSFYAEYTTTDVTGTTNLHTPVLTDGQTYNGSGTFSDYYLAFDNDSEAYDYVIIDLGKEYFSLTEFDVSFYLNNLNGGTKLPFQITFEVSSKVYVPTISQGAAFDDADWNYVAIIQEEHYIQDPTVPGRYHFDEDSRFASVIEGAFGRYLKVTFYYADASCGGVLVDEIMVSGSEKHDRMNIADGNFVFVDEIKNDSISDGILVDQATTGTEFIVDFTSVKTGIQSFEFSSLATTGATVDIYITASVEVVDENNTPLPEEDAKMFVQIADDLALTNGIIELSKKYSARRMKFVASKPITSAELRVFGDAGNENFYEQNGITVDIKLKSGAISMSNVISTFVDGSVGTSATLTALNGTGTTTYAHGARGEGTGYAMTDGFDAGYANGVSYVETSKGLLWYGLHTSKRGSANYINATFVTAWTPKLDSTSVDFVIGNKQYEFVFNGNKDKGFVVLNDNSAVPFEYSAIRTDTEWIVEFVVSYTDATGNNIPSDAGVKYNVIAYEGTSEVGKTGEKTFNSNGQTTGWSYSDVNSSWTTLRGYTGTEVVATLVLDKVYYGVNQFAISVLEAGHRGYSAPKEVRFQASLDGVNWTDVGYTSMNPLGDYRYYEQFQPGEAYVYNFSAKFEGTTAKYVRALMTVDDAEGDATQGIAVQEFFVNALSEPLKASGGDSENSSFDYKMLWDDEYLYIALQYEEDEVPFYTATHNYYETFAMVYDTAKWSTDGTNFETDPKTGKAYTNSFAKSDLKYDKETGFFQLEHTITRPGDNYNAQGLTTNGYYNQNLKNIQLYKVTSITYNTNDAATKGHFKFSGATKASTIETSVTNITTPTGGKQTLTSGTRLNGYVIVCDGYALSQDINGQSLSAVPINVTNSTIAASEINNEIVWFFESDENVDFNATSKSLGDYLIYGFRYGTNGNSYMDNVYLDGITGMMYTKYFITRAYQGMLWENVYTFPRTSQNQNTYFNYINTSSGTLNPTPAHTEQPVDARNYHSAPDINWNVVYDSASGNWSFYLKGQGNESYNNMLDDIDGASSFRLYMSVSNLNDTARYDYGNYDFILDTYVIDDNVITLKDGSTHDLTSDLDAELYEHVKSEYLSAQNKRDFNTAWNGYKNVEFKTTALGMTSETNDYQIDVSKIKGKAKFDQSENGQALMTVEIAIPFTQLGYKTEKTGTTVNKFGNYYTKIGIEKPLGKRTLMQFDTKYDYTNNNAAGSDLTDVDEFYYYVDAAEFGYILQMAPEGKGYQDMSYTDGEGYSTISSVRGEVLNTQNGNEIEYNPVTFNISKIHTTNADPKNANLVSELNNRDSFRYVEEDGMYYFTSQLDSGRVINQGGDMSTVINIPAGGAYFSFDWKVQSETSDTLSVWVEQTSTWNAQYADWIGTYNCGIPYKRYNANGTASQVAWTGILDYYDTASFTLYSEAMQNAGFTEFQANNVELKNDACVGFISGYKDITRNPEEFILASWKESNRSVSSSSWNVNIGDVLVYSPLVGGSLSTDHGMFRHVWDWNNVTIWIPNTSDAAIDYTITWMYWKNGSLLDSYNASDGRGTDDAQITNFRLSTTDELGYWKNTENWDTLRLDSNVVDPSETALGIKQLAKYYKNEAGDYIEAPAISATANNINNTADNTFGTDQFLTLSYAAITKEDVVGTTTDTLGYVETKDKIKISAANVPASDIEQYKNNAIIFTQEYNEIITSGSEDGLSDWTVLELKYNTAYNTWTLNRMFEEGVDKSKFNIYPDDNTIVILLNYTYDGKVSADYGMTREAVLFAYGNREVLKLMTPEIRYTQSDDKLNETLAASLELDATQFFTSNIFLRENYNIARGKTYSLRHYPTYSDSTYMYTENWFRENNTEDALAAFLAVYAETPLYYINEKGETWDGTNQLANTDGDYSKAFVYEYTQGGKQLRFDTNQYSDLLYVPAGVGQLTDGDKLSVYSDAYRVEALEDYAIGYFVQDTMGTPDAGTVEGIYPDDLVYSYTQGKDAKHDIYEVREDVNTREENIILDLGTVEYGLSSFTARFAGGGEDGVVFPTSVDFSISTDGLSYYYIGSVALDDTGYNSATFNDAYASVIYTGATDTVYGNTLADYTFDLQTVGVTARYIKATIMNHSAENAKMFVTEFTATQNAVVPDKFPITHASTWIDVSDDASLMYRDPDTFDRWDNVLNNPYSFAIAPTKAGYLFAEDEGYEDDTRADTETNKLLTGQLTDGVGGAALAGASTLPTLDELKEQSVGWMKAYASEVSLTFKLDEKLDENGVNVGSDVGYVSVYALHSKSSVDKITMPYNVTAYVGNSTDGDWTKVATVNAKDNDSSELSIKGIDAVAETEQYIVYKYTLAFARDGELAQRLDGWQYAKVVAETDGGEDGWICLTEVEVYDGHECYPVYDLTDDKYKKTALGLTSEEIANQDSEVRPTFFRGFYDTDKYYSEIQASGIYNGQDSSKAYNPNMVFNNNDGEQYTVNYVYANVEQRALDGRGIPYFYVGDQLLLRVTADELNASGYTVNGDWVSSYKLSAESKIYFNNVNPTAGTTTTQLFTTTAVPTPQTVCNVLARDKFEPATGSNFANVPNGIPVADENAAKYYYYLPIYMLNSLDYLKAVGYNVDTNNHSAAQFINMPANKVEITGDLVWDTNTESNEIGYEDDKNGISLNIAPMGAKTNEDTVTYNSVQYGAGETLRFGSIWYIDDAAYYNTHTHRQEYGTLLLTMSNLSRYFTDTLATKYRSVFQEYGIPLTKLDNTKELTGIHEVSNLTEVKKLTGVTEVIKLTNVAEITEVTDSAEITAKNYTFTTEGIEGDIKYWYTSNSNINKISFTTVRNGETQYWGSDENIDATATGIGRVWYTSNGSEYDYWYCANANVKDYKFTTMENNTTKYWYCNENVRTINWIANDENGVKSYWYCTVSTQTDFTNVKYNVLADNKTVVYYVDNDENPTNELIRDEADFEIVTYESNGNAQYWTSDINANGEIMSWTFTTTDASGNVHYWYDDSFTGIAGSVIEKDGNKYATATVLAYDDVVTTRDTRADIRYYSAKNKTTFDMLVAVKSFISLKANGNPIASDMNAMAGDADKYEAEVISALGVFLDYANKYSEGKQAVAREPLGFGGLASRVRANKYYYFCNITDELVPNKYGTGNDIFGTWDSNKESDKGGYNETELLGMYNYDQRYIEFDAILAGVPENQRSAKVVAIPYVIYANNYEFLEFGEILGDGDAYVEDTWHNVFQQYYGNGGDEKNMRYYVYGMGIARNITDILEAQNATQE